MKGSMKAKQKTIFNVIGFLLIAGYFLPTSTEEFTLNPTMRYYGFFFLDALAAFIIMYERRVDKKRVVACLVSLALLFVFTFVSMQTYTYRATTGNLLLYGTCFICCNVTFRKIHASRFWDSLFMAAMTVILVFGFGTILMNDTLNSILRKYYVDHLYFFLDNMLLQLKPVTFFTSHSMSAFNYTLFIVVFFIRNTYYKKSILNKVYIGAFVVLMFFLRSNSAILFLFLLYGLYLYYSRKHLKHTTVLMVLASLFVVGYFIAQNVDVINSVFSSKENGITGRYSMEGALASSIRFVEDINLPTGLTDVKYEGTWILYRDSSYLINMMRGGIFLVLAYSYVVVCFIKDNLRETGMHKLFVLLVLLFDIGYTFTWEQRFLTGFLFMIPYVKFLTCRNRRPYIMPNTKYDKERKN